MSSTLSINSDFTRYEKQKLISVDSTFLSSTTGATAAFKALRLNLEPDSKNHQYWYFIGAVILLHLVAVIGYLNRDTTSHFVQKKHEVAIEFIKPEVIPPPPIEPPKPPPPPPPKVNKVVTPPPQPALRTPVADEVIAPTDITVQENTQAPVSTAPVEAAVVPTPPAPPAPVVEEPITEATANAGYLNNPKPEYPASAIRQGWGGTVVLRVRVLANGSAESVQVKKSSGRKVLDESAMAAVKNWTFVPSKRGSTPIDGWATVPIVFNPEQ